MAVIHIGTPPEREDPPSHTPEPDYVRGTAQRDLIHRPLTGKEKRILEQLTDLDLPKGEILDAILLGELRRTLTDREERDLVELTEPPKQGKPEADNLVDALRILEDEGSRPFDLGPDPNDDDFRGGDRLFGRGGPDYIADLRGSNLVMTDEAADHILLGRGSDRIFDRGGHNTIRDLGGDNSVIVRDGDDTITTGNGDDIINAFDGRNLLDAGDGDNMVRGGNGYDNVTVGIGDDFVEVRNGTAGEAERFNLPSIGITRFRAHNFVFDLGGSDNIRASGNSKDRDSDVKDLLFNGNDLVLSDVGLEVFGEDRIEVGGGHNLIVDFGGHTYVRTLEGDDIIFTSFEKRGRDEIDAGFGNDIINPGRGRDIVRGGPEEDLIFLEKDGDRDRTRLPRGRPLRQSPDDRRGPRFRRSPGPDRRQRLRPEPR